MTAVPALIPPFRFHAPSRPYVLRQLFGGCSFAIHGQEQNLVDSQLGEPDDHRLKIRIPTGQETWIHTGSGLRQPDLDAESSRLLGGWQVIPGEDEAVCPARVGSPRWTLGVLLVLETVHHAFC